MSWITVRNDDYSSLEKNVLSNNSYEYWMFHWPSPDALNPSGTKFLSTDYDEALQLYAKNASSQGSRDIGMTEVKKLSGPQLRNLIREYAKL